MKFKVRIRQRGDSAYAPATVIPSVEKVMDSVKTVLTEGGSVTITPIGRMPWLATGVIGDLDRIDGLMAEEQD